jgi:RHS repeat-associated protein
MQLLDLPLHAATSALPAPLPEFMDDAQAAKWTADQEAAAAKETAAATSEPSTQFFTGKPYVADAGGYIYKYRTYNPEMSRWTTSDPSGFPDGVNNQKYFGSPLSGVDATGLDWTFTSGPTSISPYMGTASPTPDAITADYLDTLSISGYGTNTLTVSVSAETDADTSSVIAILAGAPDYISAVATSTFTLTVSSTGVITPNGTTTTGATAYNYWIGDVGSGFDFGGTNNVIGNTNTYSAGIGFGNAYNPVESSTAVSFGGAGASISVTFPGTPAWSQPNTNSFTITASE